MTEDLVTVHVTHRNWEAHLIKDYLEQEGVPAHLDFEAIGPIYGLTVDGIGEVRLKVLARDVELARRLVQAYFEPPAE